MHELVHCFLPYRGRGGSIFLLPAWRNHIHKCVVPQAIYTELCNCLRGLFQCAQTLLLIVSCERFHPSNMIFYLICFVPVMLHRDKQRFTKPCRYGCGMHVSVMLAIMLVSAMHRCLSHARTHTPTSTHTSYVCLSFLSISPMPQHVCMLVRCVCVCVYVCKYIRVCVCVCVASFFSLRLFFSYKIMCRCLTSLIFFLEKNPPIDPPIRLIPIPQVFERFCFLKQLLFL